MVLSLSWIPLLGAALALGLGSFLFWLLNEPEEPQEDDATTVLFTLRYDQQALRLVTGGFVGVAVLCVALLGLLVMVMPPEPQIVLGYTAILTVLPILALLVYLEVANGRLDITSEGVEKFWVLGKMHIPWSNVKEVRIDWRKRPLAIESLKHGTIWVGFYEGLNLLGEQVIARIVPSRVAIVSAGGQRTLLSDYIEARSRKAPPETFEPPEKLDEKIEAAHDVDKKVDWKIYSHAKNMRHL